MTLCTSDGYIVDFLGRYRANKNDAEILKDILDKNEDFKTLLNKGDIFVLDRGFRDVVGELEVQGFKVLMPSSKGKRNQLSTEEANHSRRVTAIRWLVEAVHGAIGQKYKLMSKKLDNKLLENASNYCKIASYLQNSFGKRFYSNVGMEDYIVTKMNESDLKLFFTGSYQLKMAVSYLAKLVDKNGSFNLSHVRESPEIIKFQVRYRHITS